MPPARPDAHAGQLVLVFDAVSDEPGDDASPVAVAVADTLDVEPPPTVQGAGSPLAHPQGNPNATVELEEAADPTDDWRALLDFERAWSGSLAAKQRAIRDSLGLSSARYHQQLDRALELPEALAYDPALVGRLRRVREARRRKRFARRVEASG